MVFDDVRCLQQAGTACSHFPSQLGMAVMQQGPYSFRPHLSKAGLYSSVVIDV